MGRIASPPEKIPVADRPRSSRPDHLGAKRVLTLKLALHANSGCPLATQRETVPQRTLKVRHYEELTIPSRGLCGRRDTG